MSTQKQKSLPTTTLPMIRSGRRLLCCRVQEHPELHVPGTWATPPRSASPDWDIDQSIGIAVGSFDQSVLLVDQLVPWKPKCDITDSDQNKSSLFVNQRPSGGGATSREWSVRVCVSVCVCMCLSVSVSIMCVCYCLSLCVEGWGDRWCVFV